jgi:hypothetical protein
MESNTEKIMRKTNGWNGNGKCCLIKELGICEGRWRCLFIVEERDLLRRERILKRESGKEREKYGAKNKRELKNRIKRESRKREEIF